MTSSPTQEDEPIADLVQLYDNLNTMITKYPYNDTVTVELHKGTPQFIVAEDVLLFRSCLNLLCHCINVSNCPPHNKSGLRIRTVNDGEGPELLVEAFHGPIPIPSSSTATTTTTTLTQHNKATPRIDDKKILKGLSGSPSRDSSGRTRLVTAEEARCLFLDKQSSITSSSSSSSSSASSSSSMLRPVAIMVRSMGGRYGMFNGRWVHSMNCERIEQTQTIYWFRIPYELPNNNDIDNNNDNNKNSTEITSSTTTTMKMRMKMIKTEMRKTFIKTHRVPIIKKQKKKKKKQEEWDELEKELMEDDPLFASLLEVGCGTTRL